MHLSNKHVQTIQEFLQDKGFIYGKVEAGIWCPVTQDGYTQYSIRSGVDPVAASMQPNNVDALPQVFKDLIELGYDKDKVEELIEEPTEEVASTEGNVMTDDVTEDEEVKERITEEVEVAEEVSSETTESETEAVVEEAAEEIVEDTTDAEVVVEEAEKPTKKKSSKAK